MVRTMPTCLLLVLVGMGRDASMTSRSHVTRCLATHQVSEALSVSFAQQMLQAVEACHFTGFAHLDIKPENFIFEKRLADGQADPTSRLVLVDYGCSEAFAIAPYAAESTDYVDGLVGHHAFPTMFLSLPSDSLYAK